MALNMLEKKKKSVQKNKEGCLKRSIKNLIFGKFLSTYITWESISIPV